MIQVDAAPGTRAAIEAWFSYFCYEYWIVEKVGYLKIYVRKNEIKFVSSWMPEILALGVKWRVKKIWWWQRLYLWWIDRSNLWRCKI